MRDEPVHLFLNPTAGRGRAGRREPRIREILSSREFPLVVHLSRAVGDLEEQVHNCVADGNRRIVVAGGDGSVHEATNGIMRAGGAAAMGLIPTGTGNDFAKAASIPLDWEHAAALLADRIADRAPSRRIDVGRINERFFANGAGIGLDARVTRIARSYRLPVGDLVYLFAIIRTLFDGVSTPRMRITTEAGVRDGPVTMANIANGDWIGGMFHIVPAARNDDGHFDLLIVDPVSRLRILRLLPKLMAGRHINEREIGHELVTAVLVESEQPLESHLDGEVQPPQERFEVSLLPGALRLL